MFEELAVGNFQKHSTKTINLSSNASIISGPSDSGKSSLIRALRWVCLNQPQGDGFVKDGSDSCCVTLFVDGHTISRIRGKSENVYILDGKEYRAFGQSVPDEIAAILNVGDINFQGQHDSVFWFSETAGEVSRQLNAVVDLGVIDTALFSIAGKVRLFQNAVQISKNRLEIAKEKKKSLEWVAVADSDYRVVELIESNRAALQARWGCLIELVSSYQIAEKTRHQAACIAGEAKFVGLIGVEARRLADRSDGLRCLIEGMRSTQAVIDVSYPDVSEVVACFEKFEELSKKSNAICTIREAYNRHRGIVDSGCPDVSELEGLVAQYNEFECKGDLIKHLVWNVRLRLGDFREAVDASEKAHKELESVSDGICPVCGKEMR